MKDHILPWSPISHINPDMHEFGALALSQDVHQQCLQLGRKGHKVIVERNHNVTELLPDSQWLQKMKRLEANNRHG